MANSLFDLVTGQNLCEQAVELARKLGNNKDLANALFYLGETARNLGKLTEARALLEECISLCWQENYTTQLNISLTNLGLLLNDEDDFKGAVSTLEEALAIATRIQDMWGIAHALYNLGVIHRSQKNLEEAAGYMERSVEVSEKIGNRKILAIALTDLSIFSNIKQDYARSDDYAERAFGIFQDIGDELQQPLPLRMMGYAAIHAGNLARARALMQESLAGNYSGNDDAGQLASLIGMANCDLAEKDIKGAALLSSLAKSQAQERNIEFEEPDAIALDHVIKQCRRKLGKAGFESAQEQGRSLKLEDTIIQLMA